MFSLKKTGRWIALLVLLALIVLWRSASNVSPKEIIPDPETPPTAGRRPARLGMPMATALEKRGRILFEPDRHTVRPHPLLEEDELANGLRFLILPHPEPAGHVSLRLVVEAGSLMEEEDERGIAHYLEHMAFNGSKNFPTGEAMASFQRLGVGTGKHANANTSFQHTVYKLDLPHNDPTRLKEAFEFFRDVADGIEFAPDEVERERGVVMQEARLHSKSKWFDMFEHLTDDALLTHRDPIGTREGIESFQQADFLRFYEKWYTANRMILVVTGDLEYKPTKKLIADHFSSLPLLDRLPDPVPGEPRAENSLVAFHRPSPDINRHVAVATLSHAPTPDPELRPEELFRRDLLFRLVQWMVEHRWSDIDDRPGPLYGSDVTLNRYEMQGLGMCHALAVKTIPSNDSLEAMTTEWQRLVAHGFTQSEFEHGKLAIIRELRGKARELFSRGSRPLADDIVQQLKRKRIISSPLDDLGRAATFLSTLERKHCDEAFAAIWKGGPMTIGHWHDGPAPTPEELRKKHRDAQARGGSKPVEPHQDKFTHTDFGPPGKVESQLVHKDLGVTEVLFENGVRLNIKPLPDLAGSIDVRVDFGDGRLSLPAGQPGLAEFTEIIVRYGGVDGLRTRRLREALRNRDVSWQFAINADHFQFRGETTSDNLLTQFRLLCALLVRPGWTDTVLPASRRDLAALKEYYDHLFAMDKLSHYKRRLVTMNDSRFARPDGDHVIARRVAEATQWLAHPMHQGPLEITVTGDVRAGQVINLAAQTFGALAPRSTAPPPRKFAPVAFPDPGFHEDYFPTSGNLAIHTLFFETVDESDPRLHRHLELLAAILRDRIRREIRELLGASYYTGARQTNDPDAPGHGYIMAQVVTGAELSPRVAERFYELIEKLSSNSITHDELERARRPILAWLPLRQQQGSYWHYTVLDRPQQHPGQLDIARSIEEDYRSATVEGLNQLARNYLSPGQIRELRLGPWRY